MSRGFVGVLVLLLTISLVGPAVVATAGVDARPPATEGVDARPSPNATAANETAPAVDARINGREIAHGDFRVLRNETETTLNATVSAPEGHRLHTVLLQVNGRTIADRNVSDGTVTFDRALPTGVGNNTIRIVAEDSRNRLTTSRFWVYIERVPPAMDLREPVDTVPDPFDYEDVVVERARVDFVGTFTDLTGVRDATVSFVDPNTSTRYHTFGVGPDDPGFDEEVLLKRGRSRVRVAAGDVLGNRYATTFGVRVVDREAPAISLDFDGRDEETARYTVSGVVRDDVWVENVSIRVLHIDNGPFEVPEHDYTAVERERYDHAADRLETSFEREVRLVEGRNYVSIRAVDHRGQRSYRGYWIGYYPDRERPPTVSFLRNRTRIHGNDSVEIASLVTDGDRDLERVLVEVRNADTGRITDVESLRPADNATFLLERRLNVSAGINRVAITATDARGNSSRTTLYVDTLAGTQQDEPPAGYEDADGADESATATSERGTGGNEPTPASTEPTPTREATTGGGADGTNSPGDGAASRGGILASLTSLPWLAAVAVVLLGGGYYVWIKLTRV